MKHFRDATTFDEADVSFPEPARVDPDLQVERTRRMMDRWVQDQQFEEDVRSMLLMLRPNKHERLLGWQEYRTGGADFRVTISWNDQFAEKEEDAHPDQIAAQARRDRALHGAGGDSSVKALTKTHDLAVPRMADVIESLLVGSMKHDDDVSAQDEFDAYRIVLLEVRRRLDEMQRCYE